MKKVKINMMFVVLAILVLMITACGKKSMSTADSSSMNFYDSNETSNDNSASNEETGMESDTADAVVDKKSITSDGADNAENSGDHGTKQDVDLSNKSVVTVEEPANMIQDKIITNVNLKVETKKFDGLINTIDAKIKQLGGYVESSNISGQSYDNSNEQRTCNIVARIPQKSLDEFVGKVKDSSNVISKEVTTENVTLDYIDIESRKKALLIEQDRLYAILEKADKLDNIITLESRLSDIRYEIQKYESQLRSFDNKVQYSTVTMEINEVERITPVKKVKKSVWSRINVGFGETMYHISEGFKNFFVWFVVNLPYILLWGLFVFIIIFIIKKVYGKHDSSNRVTGSGDTAAMKDQDKDKK